MTIPSQGATAWAPSRRRRRWWSTCGCSSYPCYHPGWTTVTVINNYFWLSLSLKNNFLKVSIIVIILILFLTVCLMITLPPQLSDLVGGTAWASLVPGLQRALGDQDPQVGRDRGPGTCLSFSYSFVHAFVCSLWKSSFLNHKLSGGKSRPCCSCPAFGLWIPPSSENMMIVWHSPEYFVLDA